MIKRLRLRRWSIDSFFFLSYFITFIVEKFNMDMIAHTHQIYDNLMEFFIAAHFKLFAVWRSCSCWLATTTRIMYDFSKPIQCTDIIAMSIYYCKVGIISVNFIISFVLDKRIFSMNLFLKSCSFTRFKRLMYKILSGALGIALNSIFVTLCNSVLDFIFAELSHAKQTIPYTW